MKVSYTSYKKHTDDILKRTEFTMEAIAKQIKERNIKEKALEIIVNKLVDTYQFNNLMEYKLKNDKNGLRLYNHCKDKVFQLTLNEYKTLKEGWELCKSNM